MLFLAHTSLISFLLNHSLLSISFDPILLTHYLSIILCQLFSLPLLLPNPSHRFSYYLLTPTQSAVDSVRGDIISDVGDQHGQNPTSRPSKFRRTMAQEVTAAFSTSLTPHCYHRKYCYGIVFNSVSLISIFSTFFPPLPSPLLVPPLLSFSYLSSSFPVTLTPLSLHSPLLTSLILFPFPYLPLASQLEATSLIPFSSPTLRSTRGGTLFPSIEGMRRDR